MNERDEQALLRAKAAEDILDNPLVQEALTAIRAKWFDDLTRSKWPQRRLREQVYRQLKAVDAFEQIFRNEIASGKLAKKKLKEVSNG